MSCRDWTHPGEGFSTVRGLLGLGRQQSAAMRLSVQAGRLQMGHFPRSHCDSVMEQEHCQFSLNAHTQGLCLACRPEFLSLCSCMESPQAAPGCPLQWPILSSSSQLQAARATFLLPESLRQALGCFPPAWPKDQVTVHLVFCLPFQSLQILLIYMY